MRAPLLPLAAALLSATPLAAADQPEPVVTKVEHVYIVSADAERLFQRFRTELELPVVWPYEAHGSFASGGLSLGNAVLEVVHEGSAPGGTAFGGIALEPRGDAGAAIAELDRRRIAHGAAEPFETVREGRRQVAWTTVDLAGLPPASAWVFLCDYRQRERVAAGRAAAAAALAARAGGPLGITALHEIALTVRAVDEAAAKWRALLAPIEPTDEAVLRLGAGPRIRLIRAATEGIDSLLLRVRSLAAARQALRERKILGGEAEGALWIAPEAVDGLRIALLDEDHAPVAPSRARPGRRGHDRAAPPAPPVLARARPRPPSRVHRTP